MPKTKIKTSKKKIKDKASKVLPDITDTKDKLSKKIKDKTANKKDDSKDNDANDYLASLEEKAKEKGDEGCIFC